MAPFRENITVSAVSATGLLGNEEYQLQLCITSSIWFVVSCMGLFNNVASIVVFKRLGLTDSVTVTFFVLAFVDTGVVIINAIHSSSTVMSLMEAYHGLRYTLQPFAVTIFCANLREMLYVMNMLLTTFLAVVRCMCVARPLHFRNMFTINRTYYVAVIVIIFAAVCYAPILIFTGTADGYDRSINATRRITTYLEGREEALDFVSVTVDTILVASTQCIVVICVVILGICLRAASKFRQSTQSGFGEKSSGSVKGESEGQVESFGKMSSKEMRIVQQVAFVATVFVICNIPRITSALVRLFIPEFDLGRRYHNMYLVVQRARITFETINSSVNFYIYYVANTRFRQEWNHGLCKRQVKEA